ncbi:MAG TPA: deaminase [Patescibacteria group bacterium]|nr:deaminase [Patescibacteria group bacterium]
MDNNTYLTTADTVQTALYKAALASGHLTTQRNPIQDEFLLDIFLTDAGADQIVVPQDRPFCEQAVELAKKSVAENDGELHPYVGAVVVRNGTILSTGFRGETGEGSHAEFCALKKVNEGDVDNVDLSGCIVYTTLEPCSKRKRPKIPCATRLIKAKAARVVLGMPDKDKDVYGFSSLAEAGIHVGLFPNDLMQELLALNKEWSETRRKPEDLPPPNDTNAIASVSYYKPGTSMLDNLVLVVRPPEHVGGFYTIEDAAKNVLASGRTVKEIGVEWRRVDTQKVIVEQWVRQSAGSSNRLLDLI